MILEDQPTRQERHAKALTGAKTSAWLETLPNEELATLMEGIVLANVSAGTMQWDLLMEVVDRLRATPQREGR
jgi:hypothetical protein